MTSVPREHARHRRAGFTLVELLVVVTIIGILASLVLGSVWGAMEQARVARTRATIRKLHTMIMLRWESYATRRLPVDLRTLVQNTMLQNAINVQNAITDIGLGAPNANDPRHIALARLLAIRELMCIEMPDRFTDIQAVNNSALGPRILPQPTAVSRSYYQRLTSVAAPTTTYQSAECLYLIISLGLEDELALDQFKPSEIGDRDGDGLLEFHDGWGFPIQFLRWAPGFISELQPNPAIPGMPNPPEDPRYTFSVEHHDPLDPLLLDVPSAALPNPTGFLLTPVIYSAGADGSYDIRDDIDPANNVLLSYRNFPLASLRVPYYPYVDLDTSTPATPEWIGAPMDTSGLGGDTNPDGSATGYYDNIHNHQVETR